MRESSQMVTGPSLTSATCIDAPKTPVATGWPCAAASAATNRSNRGAATSGGAAADHEGRLPLRVDANSVNWLTASMSAADFADGPVHDALVVVEDAEPDDLAREPVAILVAIVGRDAHEDEQAPAYRTDDATVDRDRRLADALDQRPHFLTTVRSTFVTTPEASVTVVTVSGSPSAGNHDHRCCLVLLLPVVASGGPRRASTSASDIPLRRNLRSAGSPRTFAVLVEALSPFASFARLGAGCGGGRDLELGTRQHGDFGRIRLEVPQLLARRAGRLLVDRAAALAGALENVGVRGAVQEGGQRPQDADKPWEGCAEGRAIHGGERVMRTGRRHRKCPKSLYHTLFVCHPESPVRWSLVLRLPPA